MKNDSLRILTEKDIFIRSCAWSINEYAFKTKTFDTENLYMYIKKIIA